jgi:hypothetical protein
VTGKEKRFQQNRQFGPGPIKPYLNTGGTRAPSETPSNTVRSNRSGIYHGGTKPQILKNAGGPHAPIGEEGNRKPGGGREKITTVRGVERT